MYQEHCWPLWPQNLQNLTRLYDRALTQDIFRKCLCGWDVRETIEPAFDPKIRVARQTDRYSCQRCAVALDHLLETGALEVSEPDITPFALPITPFALPQLLWRWRSEADMFAWFSRGSC